MEEAHRSKYRELVRMVDAMAFADDPGTLSPDKAFEHMVLFGPCVRAIRLASAATRLLDLGFSGETVPLVRAAFEYAVTAQWAYFQPDGVDRVFSTAHADHQRKWRMLGERYGIEEEVKRRFDGTDSGKQLPKFAVILRSVSPDGFYNEQYSLLSKFLHISGDMIADHVTTINSSIRA